MDSDMLTMDEVGTVRAIEEEKKIFEWKIDDFLELKSSETYLSPDGYFSGSSCYAYIYLRSEHYNAPFENVDISLLYDTRTVPCTEVTATFSVKTVDGRSDLEKTSNNDEKFSLPMQNFTLFKFISRSDLIGRQAELVPSGALTVICTFTDIEPTFLNASTQTEDGPEIWKLQQHLREISHNGNMSDVIFKVDGQEFKAHRCVLAARSPVFSAMMNIEMKEKVTGIVVIEDMEPKTLSDFLDYLYTGSSKCLTSENVAELYTAADKYQVDVLKEICLDHMLKNVSIENFCDIFMLSVQHNEEKLNETCLQYFGKHMLEIIKTCKWQTLLHEIPIICNELLIKHQELNK